MSRDADCEAGRLIAQHQCPTSLVAEREKIPAAAAALFPVESLPREVEAGTAAAGAGLGDMAKNV